MNRGADFIINLALKEHSKYLAYLNAEYLKNQNSDKELIFVFWTETYKD